MKKKLTNQIIAILFVATIGTSCSKNCHCGDSYKKIPESFKEMFRFGIGSKWVYRLAEDTTVTDTVTLKYRTGEGSNNTCEFEYNNVKSCSEILRTFLYHSNATYFPLKINDSILPDHDILIAYSPNGEGEFLELESPRSLGAFYGNPEIIDEKYDHYILTDTFAIWTLNGNIFKEVIYSHVNPIIGVEYISDIWYSKKVGFLKIEKTSGSIPKCTWELISYDIKN